MSIMRGLAVLLSCTLLAACVAHGQQVKQTTAGKDSRVFSNHSSHSSSFFRELMQGRVYVSEHASIPGMVRGEIYRPDGRFDACFVHKLLNKYTDSKGKWGIKGHGSHAVRTYHMVGGNWATRSRSTTAIRGHCGSRP